MARIELNGVRKVYGSFEAVKRLKLDIRDGEFLVLVGPSGCGKTTTLRMIAGFTDPTEGEILMDGQLVNGLEPGDRNLGMVFQNHALFPHKTVAQNIEFGLRMKKVPKPERDRMIRDVAGMVRVTHLLDKMPAQCSGGESQRIALARTLVVNPSTFLLDEPLSSLDAKLRRELRTEIDRIHAELERTFVYVTHDQEEAMTLADRIVVMRAGEIEQMGTPMDIYGNPQSLFVADFFGSPSMNLVNGHASSDAGAEQIETPIFDIPAGGRLNGHRDGTIVIGVRPEKVGLDPDGADTGRAAEVTLVEPLGRDTLIYLRTEDERPFVSVVPGIQLDRFHEGQRVRTIVDPADTFLFAEDGRRIA